MTDAPDKIWICSHFGEYGSYFPEAVEAEGAYGGTGVEYTRTDISQARIEELEGSLDRAEMNCQYLAQEVEARQARTAELEAALKPFASHVDKSSCKITMVWRDGDYVSTYTDTLNPSDFWAATTALKDKP
jgi:phage terminase large subunit-like protein